MRQLLSLPAPLPRAIDDEPKKERPEDFLDDDNVPPDDAPLEDLLDYWTGRTLVGGPVPSETTKRRLLEACASNLKLLPNLIFLFSCDESIAKIIKDLFDRASNDDSINKKSFKEVRIWLVLNSNFFLNELYDQASKVKDNPTGGYVRNEPALLALARVNWQTAEPLILALAGGNQPRSNALANTLLYRQAISTKDSDAEEKYRRRLKSIAADRTAPAIARHTSIDALSFTEWSGRDDWYLSLFADDSLREPTDGISSPYPLLLLFNRDPEKWIPIMSRLVESKDRAVQQAAASCLVSYAIHNRRRDVILPVLPWLSDPEWLKFNPTRRTAFIQKMGDLDIPESVPGLIWIAENEPDNKLWAARSLSHYQDPRAVHARRKVLLQSKEDHRRIILEELVPAGGISDSEAVAALETYAAMTPEGRAEVSRYRSDRDEPLPLAVSIARYLITIQYVRGSLAQSVLTRAENLKKTNPALAEALLTITHGWQNYYIDLDMIHRIANGKADANTIAKALERSADLRENVDDELQNLRRQSNEAAGIGAVLLNDSEFAQTILTSGNETAQIGLLASARLTQTPLPLDQVGKLLPSKNSLLALAAERYLLAEDSKEARKLLWRQHPDQAFVTGWREPHPTVGVANIDAMAQAEEKLRAELFKENGPVEIFALVSNRDGYSRVLRIYKDKAVYTHYEDEARYRNGVVSKAELTTFKNSIITAGLQDLGPQFDLCHHNCWVSEFVSLRKDESWRIVSNQAANGWDDVQTIFDLLGKDGGLTLHYELEKQIKGLEVLYVDESLIVIDVWQRGDEVRIFVERPETEEENDFRYADMGEDADEAARAEHRREVIAQENARFSWRKLIGNKAAGVVAQPEGYTSFDKSNFPTDDGFSTGDRVQMVSADTILIARYTDGLWKPVSGRKAVRISEKGSCANLVVTPDGKWVVAAKTDSDWGDPRYAVRFNL